MFAAEPRNTASRASMVVSAASAPLPYEADSMPLNVTTGPGRPRQADGSVVEVVVAGSGTVLAVVEVVEALVVEVVRVVLEELLVDELVVDGRVLDVVLDDVVVPGGLVVDELLVPDELVLDDVVVDGGRLLELEVAAGTVDEDEELVVVAGVPVVTTRAG